MELIEKLQLSTTPIQLIKEGTFVKVYNQSYFALCKHMRFKLKPDIRQLKDTQQLIVSGGLPVASVAGYFPSAIKTEYGYFLRGKWDLSDYYRWFEYYCEGQIAIQNLPSIKTLTEKQLLFLASWQVDKYEGKVESAFIKSLKQHFELP